MLLMALISWRKSQTQKRETVSLNAFAKFLGVSRPAVSQWLNNDRIPEMESLIQIAPRLEELIGPNVYDLLGLARIDPQLDELKEQYDQVPLDKKEQFLSEVRSLLESRGWYKTS